MGNIIGRPWRVRGLIHRRVIHNVFTVGFGGRVAACRLRRRLAARSASYAGGAHGRRLCRPERSGNGPKRELDPAPYRPARYARRVQLSGQRKRTRHRVHSVLYPVYNVRRTREHIHVYTVVVTTLCMRTTSSPLRRRRTKEKTIGDTRVITIFVLRLSERTKDKNNIRARTQPACI